MKNTLRLDSYLTKDGILEVKKTALRDYYKKLSQGGIRRDKETKIKLNLVLYPEFFSAGSSAKAEKEVIEESDISLTARIQKTTPEAVKILHNSQGSLRIKNFSQKVSDISKMR